MKNNLYTKYMQEINAPDSLIESTIESMQNTKTEVCVVGKSKHTAIKFTSAVAAVLALIIGLSVIPFGGNKPDSEHNFVITAGAAEITPEMYVEVGEFFPGGSGGGFFPHNQDDPYNYEGEHSVIELMNMYGLDNLRCQGENIESITYKANNCQLAYKFGCEGLLDYEENPPEELYGEDSGVHYFDNYLWTSCCTIDYDYMQQKILSGEWIGSNVPIRLSFTFYFEKGEYVVTLDEKGYVDTSPIFEQEFNANSDEFSLDIIANFKDGKSTTKTLNFRVESRDGVLFMYAKEA